MRITVEVPEEKVELLVRNRIAELFCSDSRFRETGVRELVRKIVDDSAVAAVRSATESIKTKLPAMASEAVNAATRNAIQDAAKRGLKALSKLYAGFDPSKLTVEQRAWLESQIAGAAKHED